MKLQTNSKNYIPKMSSQLLKFAYLVEEELKQVEQKPITTMHSLHEGVYTRSIKMEKNELLVGAYIEVDTTLIIQGHLKLTVGDNIQEVNGFDIFIAKGGRKQTMLAVEDTFVTMLFKTDAQTIEEAEEEFTKDYDKLLSRKPNAINIVRSE